MKDEKTAPISQSSKLLFCEFANSLQVNALQGNYRQAAPLAVALAVIYLVSVAVRERMLGNIEKALRFESASEELVYAQKTNKEAMEEIANLQYQIANDLTLCTDSGGRMDETQFRATMYQHVERVFGKGFKRDAY